MSFVWFQLGVTVGYLLCMLVFVRETNRDIKSIEQDIANIEKATLKAPVKRPPETSRCVL